jgi:hypothetical protein
MTHQEIEDALAAIGSWTDEAADILNRFADRIDALDIRIADLHARIDEWDIRR